MTDLPPPTPPGAPDPWAAPPQPPQFPPPGHHPAPQHPPLPPGFGQAPQPGFGPFPDGLQPGQPPPKQNRGRLAVIAVGVGALVAGGIYVTTSDDSPYPSEWDERVVDLVEFVEDERGEDFDHPVEVDFLTDEEYTERTRAQQGELDEEATAEIERAEGLFRALGMAGDDLDLFESTNDLVDTGTLAFYDLFEERIIVRGTEVTPRLAATLVHELTHALQDQRFALGLLRDPGDATSGRILALRGLIEGDADRVEAAYVESLSADEQDEIRSTDEEGLDDLEQEDVPEALVATFALPYALGEGFIAAMEAESRAALDRAFINPPTTEEHLLDPRTFLEADQPHLVSVELPDDAELLDEGDFGAASLMIVLGARIDAHEAVRAAIGWGGDEYVSYTVDGRSCIDLAVTGDTEEDAFELAAAFADWVAAGPPGAASTEIVGDEVHLHACDPDEGEAVDGEGSPFAALTVAALRSAFATQATSEGAPDEVIDCFADRAVGSFSVEELTADEPPADVALRVQAAFQSCS